MKNILVNPLTIYLKRLLFAFWEKFKNRGKNLEIGQNTVVYNCTFGKYNTLYDNVHLLNVEIGDFSYVSSRTLLNHTKVGRFCSIGPDVCAGSGMHPASEFVSTHPMFFSIRKQTKITLADRNYFTEYKQTTIGNDVWVGARSIIMDGIIIGDGAIIGAGAVVTKNVPPYAIVGGVPAKIIRFRFSEEQIFTLTRVKWWDWSIDKLTTHASKFRNIREFSDWINNSNLT